MLAGRFLVADFEAAALLIDCEKARINISESDADNLRPTCSPCDARRGSRSRS